MPRLPAPALLELINALRDSYVSATLLNQFLRTKLDRRFDDLSSRYIPLSESIAEIVHKANEQGWVGDLSREAAEDRPQNAVLKRLFETMPVGDPISPPSLGKSLIDRPSLLCGRATQWNEVCQCAPARLHQVILVPAARGQEPMHFRDRIQVWLTPDPSRVMVSVDWDTPPPKSLDEMIEALGRALGPGAADAPNKLREKLAYQNLVLLHPSITEGFNSTHFVDYYTKWLPEAIAQQTSGSLKCIQPIEWPFQERSKGLLSRLLTFGGDASSPDRAAAVKLMADFRTGQRPNMRIIDVDELLNLEVREIEQFLEGSEFPPDHQRILLGQLTSGPQITGYMFTKIDNYWKSLEGRR
jgi:hypothetical protein